MIRVDMHVHSEYSKHPSEWFLQRIGAQESYTNVEEVYRVAKKRGMQFVTLTDHNTIDGALQLREQHPEDCFLSVEATTYFPENGCKIHVVVYNITETQFEQIQRLRTNIYDFREYLRSQNLACSVAHATYSVNGRLNMDLLEKLILLFDVFESINGARSRLYNEAWTRTLRNLTPADMEMLFQKHHIEPWGPESWIKGFTGGSDDHAGLLIGGTYTLAEAASVQDLIQAVRDKSTRAAGRHGDHKSLAFAIYKIAYDFSRNRGTGNGEGFWGVLNALMFDDGRLGWKNWLAVQKFKRKKESRNRIITRFFEDLVDSRANGEYRAEEQINRVYNGLATLSDDFFTMIATSLEKDLNNGDAGKLLKNIFAALPAMFLAAPFFSTMRHQHRDKVLIRQLESRFGPPRISHGKRLLWFTDTVLDLNGVSVTMRELARCAHETGRPMKLVTSLPESECTDELPLNMINLPCIYTVTPDFYTAYTLRVPSLLKSIDMIAAQNPDEIVISTPGPVGLLGLLAARLMDIPCTGVYHTDFTRQVDLFIGDEWVSKMVEVYTRLFFKMMDEVRVPTGEYIHMLAERGLDPERMKIFRRGIEPGFAQVGDAQIESIRRRFNLPDEPLLLWVGRLGKEKNMDFLLEIYNAAAKQHPGLNLLIAGDGPELDRLRAQTAGNPRIRYAGRVERANLAAFYSLADVFVFPSTTDTFGMVVLEAQACGLPAIVTDVGGPQEIVRHSPSGYIVPAHDRQAWVTAILQVVHMRDSDRQAFNGMRRQTCNFFRTGHGWEAVLDEMMGKPVHEPPADPARSTPAEPELAVMA